MGRRQTDPSDPLGVGEPELPPPPSTSGPIGVPSDYEVRPYTTHTAQQRDIAAGYGYELPTRGKPTSVATGEGGDAQWPYYDGDEFFPGQLSPDSIAALQREMALLGLLPKNARFRLGVWDAASQKAYRSLLAYANQQGMSYKQALNHMKATGANFTVDEFGNLVPMGEGGREPLPTRTTNPDELRQVFRAAVIDTLGQGWDEDKINRMIQSYNEMEIRQQQAAYEADMTGGNVVSVPSPEAFAVTQARETDPTGAQANEMLDYMNEFAQIVTSPAWGA